ncbi:VOC family protein [uncultured Gimesia sp.]|mgnify:CR=1 FL=1|uniref:VOC family protein n=1 Tax=uncultured Gimesia sp. TaxID=1678688 RepID=UPI0030D7255B|tara:strand:- start:69016 stop:69396 length:381 start_codon:yes stop_codon:yes gene_type:complete
MEVDHLDHLVLTVKDIPRSLAFYESVLGMQRVSFGAGRFALTFGNQKINLHEVGHEFEPKASHVQAGSADLCFIIKTPVEEAIEDLQSQGVEIIAGPVQRTGAMGKLISAYFRDPDGNLIEVSNYE